MKYLYDVFVRPEDPADWHSPVDLVSMQAARAPTAAIQAHFWGNFFAPKPVTAFAPLTQSGWLGDLMINDLALVIGNRENVFLSYDRSRRLHSGNIM